MRCSTLVFSLGLVWSLGGCGSAVDVPGDTEAGSSSSSSEGGGVTSVGVTTAPPATTSAGEVTTSPTTATTNAGDDSTGSDDAGFITPETGAGETAAEPQPNGGQCSSPDECESGFCYSIPQVGGVCSECLVDQDCDAGTCSLDQIGYAICTDGSQGNMCNTDEGCMGDLVCTELIDAGGLVNTSFCSVCGPTAPCEGDQICSPAYNLEDLGGSFECVDPGTVANGDGCPIEGGSGVDAVCASGHCGVASLFGFAELAVCGECNVDADCPEKGQTCVPPEASMSGLTAAFCQ